MPHAEEWLYWGNACDYTLQLESSWKKYWGVWTSFNICEIYLLKAHRAPEYYRHALFGHDLGPTCETDSIVPYPCDTDAIVPYPCDKQNFELLIIFSEQTWNLNKTSNQCRNNADKELELILGKHTDLNYCRTHTSTSTVFERVHCIVHCKNNTIFYLTDLNSVLILALASTHTSTSRIFEIVLIFHSKLSTIYDLEHFKLILLLALIVSLWTSTQYWTYTLQDLALDLALH